MPAIEYISYADASGYGQAAVGYVRLLVEAGFDVHWRPYLNEAVWRRRFGPEYAGQELAAGRAAMRLRGQVSGGNKLAALVEATSRPVTPDAQILHLLPVHWPRLTGMAPGTPTLGMTVWESDRLSADWLPMLAAAGHIAVPCQHNAQVIGFARDSGAALPPVTVVPHVARREPHPPSRARLDALLKWARIEPGDTVFYSINTWVPRKRMARLVDGFARRFGPEDRAVLFIKTSQTALVENPGRHPSETSTAAVVDAILAHARDETGRPSPRIALLADNNLGDTMIDALHAIGDCFVSLSRCEGFGLGAFDAAAQGQPVIATGYAGPVDFLGEDWPGRIPHRMVPCEPLPGHHWFDEAQCWPEPDDGAAFGLMRDFMADPAPFRAAAAETRARIQREFDDESISNRLLAALAEVLPRRRSRGKRR